MKLGKCSKCELLKTLILHIMQELMCSSNNRSLDLSLAYYQASTGEPLNLPPEVLRIYLEFGTYGL